jgi:hypothetical protein
MDPIAMSTYYFVTLGVALLCCLLPSYARCQVHRNQSQKENQKIVHPNFNLGLTRQRSIYGRLNYTISILQLSILYFFNFGLFALFKALHYLETVDQAASIDRTVRTPGTEVSTYSRIAFVFEELRTCAFLIFFFTLIRPLAGRKIFFYLFIVGFSLITVILNSVFSLDSMSKYYYHVSIAIQCSFAVRYCLVTIFMSLKVFNCGDYKLVPSNVNQTSVTYFQNSKLVSIGFLIVTSLVTSSSILSVLTLYNLPLTATLPIMMNLGTLILFSLIIFIHHLDLEFDSDHNKNITESIEQLTQNPFAQTNMDVIP